MTSNNDEQFELLTYMGSIQELTTDLDMEMDRLQLNPWQLQRLLLAKYGKDRFSDLSGPEQDSFMAYLRGLQERKVDASL